jgi:hypothetical protein
VGARRGLCRLFVSGEGFDGILVTVALPSGRAIAERSYGPLGSFERGLVDTSERRGWEGRYTAELSPRGTYLLIRADGNAHLHRLE